MKTVVISDLHLTTWFNPKKFAYLKKVISSADQVVLAGDIWDGLRCSFNGFVTSRWSGLFPLLVEKNAVYIYGNHDRQEWADKRINLFSNKQTHRFKFKAGKFTYLIEHGDRIFPEIDSTHSWILKVPFLGYGQYFFLELIPTTLFGKLYLNLRGRRAQRALKRWAGTNLKSREILVCGHDHIPELDISNRYANCGFISLKRASYLLIEENNINLIDETY